MKEVIQIIVSASNGAIEKKLAVAGIRNTPLLELQDGECIIGRFMRQNSTDKGECCVVIMLRYVTVCYGMVLC